MRLNVPNLGRTVMPQARKLSFELLFERKVLEPSLEDRHSWFCAPSQALRGSILPSDFQHGSGLRDSFSHPWQCRPTVCREGIRLDRVTQLQKTRQ